ncbi:hypothetical protein OH76DRAFT_1480144 [Lentinus brumalis]|uniref:Uncharacterized protein n=1 Tax=Lentinus brumalis TaxID=2498619 RepID=A0A371DKQ7_9APHY|nr:hypothetical protein OH76DRAFT_1480144 [Polyporus brumalis]
MPSVSSPSNGHLPRLNSPNVRTLDSLKTDRSHLLRTFVRSQEAHLSGYALDGKSLAASWSLDTGDVVGPASARKRRMRDVELESGFGTPLLKPRAQAGELGTAPKIRNETRAGDGDGDPPVKKSKESAIGTRGQASSGKVAKENVSAVHERIVADDGEDVHASKRLRQSGIREFAPPLPPAREKAVTKRAKQKETQPKVAANKGRDGDIDQEHEHRLTERRERRRAKKAIIDPKPAPPESEHSDDEESAKGKPTKKAAKKGKGLNIPAGLALMHGFSAKNIGKNRLTLNFDPGIGVFNKGKASAKTAVTKSKVTKPSLQMFSEERFLSKAPKEGRRNAASDSGTSDSETEGPCPPSRSKPKRAAAPESTSKRKRSRSPSPLSTMQSDQDSEGSQDGASPPKKQGKPAREESPVWDIELEDGQLLSGATSGISVRFEEGTRLGGTVLLDTGAFTSRWVVAEKAHLPTTSDVLTPAVEPSVAQESESSSLAPSHSASQVASRQDEHGAAGAMRCEAFSRFFTVPLHTIHSSKPQPQSSCTNPQPLVSPPPSPSPSSVDPQPHVCEDNSGVGSQDYGHRAVRWQSGLGDTLLATERLANLGPDPFVYKRVTSSNALANRPTSSVLLSTSRPSSPCLPAGPCSPASPGRVGRDTGEVVPRAVLLDLAHVPEYYAATSDQDVPPDWTMYPPDTFQTTDAPTFFSPVDRHGGMTGDHIYMQDEDELAVVEPVYFVNSYTMEEHASDLVMFSPMSSAFEHQAIAYHHDSAYFDYNRDIEVVEEEHREFLDTVDFSAEEAPYFPIDGGMAAEEDGLRWLVDDAQDGGMEPSHSFYPSDPDDDYLSSEAGFTSPGVALTAGLESDDALGSEPSEDTSVIAALPRFSQGRALLMGVAETGAGCGHGGRIGMSSIEEDVAKSLRGHWLPQRF